MNSQRSILGSFAVIMLLASLASACNRGDEKAVKGRTSPNGTAHDTVSDLALSEEGLGQIQTQCDFVFPAVGAGIPEGVSVMVVKGKIARIDVDTGSVTTEDGAKIGDSEDRIKSIYGEEVRVEPHKYNEGWHYLTVMGDSASAGKALVFETDGKRVTMFRGGRLPEVKWVEGCS